MAKKIETRGRPRKLDKVMVVSAYLRPSEKKKINKTYKNITEALRLEVLPKCG